MTRNNCDVFGKVLQVSFSVAPDCACCQMAQKGKILHSNPGRRFAELDVALIIDPLEKAALARFLHVANKRTYANKDVPQAEASRLRSQDYEFEQGDLTYHDTSSANRDLIGEQIVYKNRKPVWGANYFGFIMADEAGESELYDFLRKALMQEYLGVALDA